MSEILPLLPKIFSQLALGKVMVTVKSQIFLSNDIIVALTT